MIQSLPGEHIILSFDPCLEGLVQIRAMQRAWKNTSVIPLYSGKQRGVGGKDLFDDEKEKCCISQAYHSSSRPLYSALRDTVYHLSTADIVINIGVDCSYLYPVMLNVLALLYKARIYFISSENCLSIIRLLKARKIDFAALVEELERFLEKSSKHEKKL